MQLLFEEFFKKVFKVVNGFHFFIRTLIKLVFLIMIVLIIIFLTKSAMTGNYIIILFVLGIIILAEAAHYIRKTREKSIQQNMINNKYSTEYITKIKKAKNKTLLNKTKPKNKNLLDNKKISKKVVKKTPKNKNFLELNNPKNKNLLK